MHVVDLNSIGYDELHHKERDADVCIVLSDEVLFVGISDNYLRRSGRSDCVMCLTGMLGQ